MPSPDYPRALDDLLHAMQTVTLGEERMHGDRSSAGIAGRGTRGGNVNSEEVKDVRQLH